MSRYPNEDVARFDQQFRESIDERNNRLARQRRERKAPQREQVTVYLREIDAGTPNACWVVCAQGDPGATEFHGWAEVS